MTINFTKMHGLGNDFIVIDTRFEKVPDTEAVYRHLCDRKRGIGCDQLILVGTARDAQSDLFVRIINSGGSEVGMCGNALRCVAGMFWDKVKRKSPDTLVLATQSGHYLSRKINETQSEVLMGQAATEWQKIPLAAEQDYLNVTLANNLPVPKAGVMNIGNPHIVFIVPDAEAVPLAEWGPLIEYDAILPERANVEFIHIVDPHHIRMRVWERSAGITEACGSGACASAFIALQRGLVQSPVKVQMDGGVLDIRIDADGMIYQSGPYATAFSGQADLENSQL